MPRPTRPLKCRRYPSPAFTAPGISTSTAITTATPSDSVATQNQPSNPVEAFIIACPLRLAAHAVTASSSKMLKSTATPRSRNAS